MSDIYLIDDHAMVHDGQRSGFEVLKAVGVVARGRKHLGPEVTQQAMDVMRLAIREGLISADDR